jgi:hypothetical protein
MSWGDRRDLNPRHSRPQRDALTGLSYDHQEFTSIEHPVPVATRIFVVSPAFQTYAWHLAHVAQLDRASDF